MFNAESNGPPRRRLHIWREEPGWAFSVEELSEEGSWRPVRDAWDETYENILQYPALYAPKELTWRHDETGRVVDIYAINAP